MRIIKDLPRLNASITSLRVLSRPPQDATVHELHGLLHDHSRFTPSFERGDKVRVKAQGLLAYGRTGEVLSASSRTATVLLDNGKHGIFTPYELELVGGALRR